MDRLPAPLSAALDAFGQHLGAVLVQHASERNAFGRAVETDQFALLELEAMPARLRWIFELMRERIHAARRDFMQERLPDMRWIAVDQRDRCRLRPAPLRARFAVTIAEPCCQFQPACASSHNDKAMHRLSVHVERR